MYHHSRSLSHFECKDEHDKWELSKFVRNRFFKEPVLQVTDTYLRRL